jgi:hypothetical protein
MGTVPTPINFNDQVPNNGMPVGHFLGDASNPRNMILWLDIASLSSYGALMLGGDLQGTGAAQLVAGIMGYKIVSVPDANRKTLVFSTVGAIPDAGIIGTMSFDWLIGGLDFRTTTTELVGATSAGKLVRFSNASAVACTLTDIATDPALDDHFICQVVNRGVGTVTFTPTSGTINGSATATLATGMGGWLSYDGTDWELVVGGGGGSTYTPPVTTKGDLFGFSTVPDRVPVGTDGQFLVADSSQTLGVRYSDLPAFLVGASPGQPTTGQLLGALDAAGYSITFAGNFANSVGQILPGGVNPTATVTCIIKKNTTNIGTVVISTSGVFTFTSTSGLPVTLNPGDTLSVFAPAIPDATLALFTFTIFGNKGLVASNSIVNPAVIWKGAWSNATTYNTYELVSYFGGVYISIASNTGNPPTLDGNNSFWQFVMGDGWNSRGVYAGGTTYNPNDVVRYIATGSSYGTYRCILTTTGNVPTNVTYWVPVAEAGIDGTTTSSQVQQQSFVFCGTAGGTGNAITLTPSPSLGSLTDGTGLEFRTSATNTTTVTVNVSSLGAVALVKPDGTALSGGELASGCIYRIVYNSTTSKWQMEGGGGGGGVKVQDVAGSVVITTASQISFPNGSVSNPSGSIAQIAGGLVLLEQHSASSSTSLNLTTGITSIFDEYVIEMLQLVPSANGIATLFRVSTNGGSTYDSGANYYWSGWRASNGGSTNSGSTSGTSIGLDAAGGISNTAVWGGFTGFLRFYNPLGGVAYPRIVGNSGYVDGSLNPLTAMFSGLYKSTTPVNACQVLPSSGNWATGIIRLYGVCK